MKRAKPTQKSILLQVIREQDAKFRCIADSKCSYEQAVLNAGNFKRHVQAQHPTIYERLGLASPAADEADSVTTKKKPKKLVVESDRSSIILGTLQLITVNHLPYSFFEMSPYKTLLGPLYDTAGITINRKTISNLVDQGSRLARGWIKEEMEKKLISLKIDSASRGNRHVFGINTQYYHQGKVVIRNLGE